jgi:hypothetical protein
MKNTDKTVEAPYDTPDRALITEPNMAAIPCTEWTKHLGQCRGRLRKRSPHSHTQSKVVDVIGNYRVLH